MQLFAVHISDGFLEWPWWLSGFALALVFWLLGAWRITDRDIPRIGVVTAAFFVASQLHLPTGVGSVHLVLNGLAGVLLKRRVSIAIGVGLFLQAVLFEHGGRTMLGLNTCIMTIPAIAAGYAFPVLRRSRILHLWWVRGLFVALLCGGWLLLATFATQVAVLKFQRAEIPSLGTMWIASVWVQLGIGIIAILTAYSERKLEPDPDFALGLLLGAGTVAATVVLKALVLWAGGRGDWQALASADLVAHTPVIVLEGLAVGFAVRVLSRAKPEWLA